MTPELAKLVVECARDSLVQLRSTLTHDPRGAAVAYELGRAVGHLAIALEHLRNDTRPRADA